MQTRIITPQQNTPCPSSMEETRQDLPSSGIELSGTAARDQLSAFRAFCLSRLQALALRHDFRGCPRIVTTFARRFLPGGVQPYRVATGDWMYLDPSDYMQATMLFGIFGYEIRFVTGRLLRPGDTYVDIGAQLGYFTMIASRLVGLTGSVHAFEPDPGVHRLLMDAVAANLRNNVHVNAVAVGETEGTLEFYVSNMKGWSSRINMAECQIRERIAAPMIDLDRYLERHGVAAAAVKLIKMDIEGGEPWALRGMHRTLSDDSAPMILAEYAPTRLQHAATSGQNIRETLWAYDYRPYLLRRKPSSWAARAARGFRYPAVELVPVDRTEPLSHCDLLFTRRGLPRI